MQLALIIYLDTNYCHTAFHRLLVLLRMVDNATTLLIFDNNKMSTIN